MKRINRKRKIELHPIMTYMVFIIIIVVLSGFLKLLDLQSTFYKVNSATLDTLPQTEAITSILSLSGIKYIFTNTVSNFATFTVLSNLIIILMGISVLDKSGFLQTIITLTTKKMKKTAVTFIFVLICILSSIVGDLSYLVLIPLGALLFYYGKRNPQIGIIAAFASLACGSGLNLLFNATDSELLTYTIPVSHTIKSEYVFPNMAYLFIMIAAVLLVTYVITLITENYIAKKLPKYEFSETELEEDIVTKPEKRGMMWALIAGIIYILIIVYNIIPGLPLSGTLLDNSQTLYIDRLFNPASFFSHGFVFIVTILFVILGLFYGMGSKSIKNQKDFCEFLSHSLDGIGTMLVMILFASILISVFKRSNMGNVVVASIGNMISNSGFMGISLILLVFIGSFISTLVVPSSAIKWSILSAPVVQTMMKSEMTPVFAQLVYRFGEATTMNLTPLLAYFVVYLAFLRKYSQGEKKFGLIESIKYQLPYTGFIIITLLVLIVFWYVFGLPLGINSYPLI